MIRTSATRSYWWLKAIIITSIVAAIYLLLTHQYMVLVQIAACVLGGYILYRVIKHRMEHPRQEPKTTEAPEIKVKEIKNHTEENIIDMRKISTKDLIEELARRGEIR